MKKILITGGTVFVSKFLTEYFLTSGYEVFVLNRNTKEQVLGAKLIQADRHNLTDELRPHNFDAVIDVNAYTKADVQILTDALGSFRDYILISSSAVYPETLPQPFREDYPTGYNRIWGDYGTGKCEAESYLTKHCPQAYILRPPYLYGPMQNLYREPFVFECALEGRPFVLPKKDIRLQFFHVRDLCRFIEILLSTHPRQRIFNVGNPLSITAKEWVTLCYEAAGRSPSFVLADPFHSVRSYFCFHDYSYELDVSAQSQLLKKTTPLSEGLKEYFDYYLTHKAEFVSKPYKEYIDKHITNH